MAANNLTTTDEFIGDSRAGGSNGIGTIDQSGGTNTDNGLFGLGENANDHGVYNLSVRWITRGEWQRIGGSGGQRNI